MAKVSIPCLVGKPNKAGIVSWYWQPSKTLRDAGFVPEALGKDEAKAIARAQELNRQVDKWKAGGELPQIRTRRMEGTFGSLIERYRREVVNGKKPSGADRLRPKTREAYETGLKRLELWAGDHPVAFITPARVGKLRNTTARPIADGGIGHSAAFNLLRVLRQVMAFAEKVEIIPKGSNPATDFELAPPPPRSSIWSAEDEAAFIASAYELGFPSLVLARELAEYTAQREGDLIQFTEPQFSELEIFDLRLRELLAGDDSKVWGWKLEQTKTSTEYSVRQLEIPFEPKLAAKVAEAIRTNRARDRALDPPRLITHVLVDDRTGRPWSQNAFQHVVREIRDHAADRTGRPHMKRLTWHDWRRTRVVRLRRKGMPKEMIASITGHDPKSIDEMLKVYGPIDPTVTAAALASVIEIDRPAPAAQPNQEEA